jgi:hypothetical protein
MRRVQAVDSEHEATGFLGPLFDVEMEREGTGVTSKIVLKPSRCCSSMTPSSATMNRTRRDIRPLMKATSRERRSSFATTTAQSKFSYYTTISGVALGLLTVSIMDSV